MQSNKILIDCVLRLGVLTGRPCCVLTTSSQPARSTKRSTERGSSRGFPEEEDESCDNLSENKVWQLEAVLRSEVSKSCWFF